MAKLNSSYNITAQNIIWEVLPSPTINNILVRIDRSNSYETTSCYRKKIKYPLFLKKLKWFKLYDGTLYKKSFTQPLLKCVTPTEENTLFGKSMKEGVESNNGFPLSSIKQSKMGIIGHG